ncbi:MAG: DUF188 domain-containing protein [Spirochaetes bacterium]|nr:DUF188 domain-containing protein [Spirochaetota bacterium]
MTVWADADSLPRGVRDRIARRVARERERRQDGSIHAVFASNRPIPFDAFDGSTGVVVEAPSTADDLIAERAVPGDLVVTRDIPLAERVIARGVAAINDRGDSWTPDTVRERRSLRDFMEKARALGTAAPVGNRSYGPAEERAFANAFDRVLSRLLGA